VFAQTQKSAVMLNETNLFVETETEILVSRPVFKIFNTVRYEQNLLTIVNS